MDSDITPTQYHCQILGVINEYVKLKPESGIHRIPIMGWGWLDRLKVNVRGVCGMLITGLAYPNWYDHAPYLCSLWWLMQTWMGSKPDIIAKDRMSWLWTEAEIYELKKILAEYYVNTFFLYFGQPPTLPRYLPHNPQTLFVPMQHICGQMATPNVHADISKWE
ncbi:hypothetical protein EDD18DRAFT_1098019 [Armillaria luteobubalina]|uniref:Uncharacterized protein n=1 Tax=Armillaria luteobubalina TaxID=153913 RepID=A0AA39QQW8_9AGAR|nr:hypothetical protein EDD18DRAFT_1098019 [Armillaria luteobubalina]